MRWSLKTTVSEALCLSSQHKTKCKTREKSEQLYCISSAIDYREKRAYVNK